jgi:hypothetical protein
MKTAHDEEEQLKRIGGNAAGQAKFVASLFGVAA